MLHADRTSEKISRTSAPKGREYSRRATHKWLSQALKGGAGPAHRWCGKEDALPDMPLVIRDNQGHFTADPQSVAEHCAKEWKREWSDEDKIGFDKETSSIRDLRFKHVSEAHEWAGNLDLSATSIRKACLSFPSKTAIGLDTHSKTLPYSLTMLWFPWVRSSGSVLSSWPYQFSHFYNIWSCWVRKWREQNHRHLAHNIPSHHAFGISTHQSMGVNFVGKWDSAVKGNSALRAHVARAMGIELAHSEGQFVIHFLWDMRKFYDSIKAHLLIPQLVARGYLLEILVLGTLTHKSPRCLQVGNSYSNIIMGCASSILAGCLQSCSWARGLMFEFVQALGYVVPGSVCEEHIDDLSHFVTNKSRMQLFQDAAETAGQCKSERQSWD